MNFLEFETGRGFFSVLLRLLGSVVFVLMSSSKRKGRKFNVLSVLLRTKPKGVKTRAPGLKKRCDRIEVSPES
jgi:hypothetical protein